LSDHLSGTAVADGLSRAYPSDDRAGLDRSYSLLLQVGFAKPPCRHGAGALLPHRFSFSPDLYRRPEGYRAVSGESSFLWHFPSPRGARPLACTLPCGVRTFLTCVRVCARPRGRPAHSD